MSQAVNFRTILISMLLGILLFSLFGSLIYGVYSNYDLPIDGNYSDMFEEINISMETSTQFAENLQNSTELSSGFSPTGGEAGIAEVMSQTIKLPFSQIKSLQNVKDIIASKFGIPVTVLNLLLGIILIVISLVFLSVLFRTPGGM